MKREYMFIGLQGTFLAAVAVSTAVALNYFHDDARVAEAEAGTSLLSPEKQMRISVNDGIDDINAAVDALQFAAKRGDDVMIGKIMAPLKQGENMMALEAAINGIIHWEDMKDPHAKKALNHLLKAVEEELNSGEYSIVGLINDRFYDWADDLRATGHSDLARIFADNAKTISEERRRVGENCVHLRDTLCYTNEGLNVRFKYRF